MKTTTEIKANANTDKKTQVTVELHKVGATAVGISSLLLGGWAVACMTAALIVSGGPVGLATDYIKALIG